MKKLYEPFCLSPWLGLSDVQRVRFGKMCTIERYRPPVQIPMLYETTETSLYTNISNFVIFFYAKKSEFNYNVNFVCSMRGVYLR